MKHFCFLVLTLCMAGCGPAEQAGFDGFEQMLGTWASPAGDGQVFTETWTREGNRLLGQGVLVRGTDTLFGERLVAEKINGRLVYIADVPGQNPVLFTRTGNGKSFRFENKEHDFPRTIIYEPQRDDRHVQVIVQGNENGKEKTERLMLEKQQP